jgi:hypothetical protein
MHTVHLPDRDAEHPSPHRARVATWELLVALFLAPAGFAVQVIAGYVVAARLCSAGLRPVGVLVTLHATALLAAAIGMGMAWRLWRRSRDEKPGDARQAADRGEGRTRFLALCAVCSSLIFLLAVLMDLASVLLLGACPGLPVAR